ncbi:MAG: hypothetical protein ACK4V6_00295 [Microthrixaceae bacterium]
MEANAPAPEEGALVPTRWVGLCFLAGAVAILLVAAPRFARHESVGPSTGPTFVTAEGDGYLQLVTDHVEYFRLIEHFAGTGPAPDTAPFTGRLVAPWLAAQLPFDAPVALAVVDLLLLGVGLASMLLLLRSWGISRPVLALATAAYALSFPVLWYGAANWVDPAAVGLIGLCILAAYRRWWLGALALVPAVLTKESALVCVVFGVALELTRPGRTSRGVRLARAGAWLGAAAASWWLLAALTIDSPVVFAPWVPGNLEVLLQVVAVNMRSAGSLSLVLLSGLLPLGILVGLWLTRRRRPIPRHVLVPLLAGALGALGLSALALVGALWDGRLIWATYPFLLPLGAWMLEVQRRTFAERSGLGSDPSFREMAGPLRAELTPRRVVRAGLAAVGLFVAILVLGGVWGVLGEVLSPRASVMEPNRVAFADRLDELRLDEVVDRSGRGDAAVPIPMQRDAPLLVDYEHRGPGELRLVAPSGDTLVEREGAAQGTVVLDATDQGALEVLADGAWSLRFRSISDAFHWSGYAPMSGASDAVILIPGGSIEVRTVELRSDDPDAHLTAITADGARRLDSGDVLPPGTEALAVISAAEWELFTLVSDAG